MVEFTGKDKAIDRRGFLKGSALFAAVAVGLTVAQPAFAQQSPEPGKPDEKKPEEKKPEDPAAKKEAPAKQGDQAKNEDPDKLVDKNGREYRVCERCGGNMYKEGNTWTCEQCGFNYTE
jgi:hypothetical protein